MGEEKKEGMRAKCRSFMELGKTFTAEQLAEYMGIDAAKALSKMGLLVHSPGERFTNLEVVKNDDKTYTVIALSTPIEIPRKSRKKKAGSEETGAIED